jgi:hypothetical protein
LATLCAAVVASTTVTGSIIDPVLS